MRKTDLVYGLVAKLIFNYIGLFITFSNSHSHNDFKSWYSLSFLEVHMIEKNDSECKSLSVVSIL